MINKSAKTNKISRPEVIRELFASMMEMRRSFALKQAAGMHSSDDAPTKAQIGLLFILAREPQTQEPQRSQHIKDIARQLFTSSSAATQLVNELVAKGLVVRKADKVDRRKVELVLTPAGKKCLKQAKKDHIKMTEKMLKGLDDRELVQFLTLHKKLAQHSHAK